MAVYYLGIPSYFLMSVHDVALHANMEGFTKKMVICMTENMVSAIIIIADLLYAGGELKFITLLSVATSLLSIIWATTSSFRCIIYSVLSEIDGIREKFRENKKYICFACIYFGFAPVLQILYIVLVFFVTKSSFVYR